QERPYHSDSTASRLLSEVKHCRARLVLRWGTTLESLVLFFLFFTFHTSFLFDYIMMYLCNRDDLLDDCSVLSFASLSRGCYQDQETKF
ncbi:hypothetical protein ACHAWC_009972, partial [Mediolabrus comicus]